ncbi:MAG: 23S rRNA (uracil(1939)-C(5))-methyltransferase RlmD, partial [Lachnospiraceae bacterium]|nr:23S rRNA (uracil(1939)-C(5))-methyltransferase RlmD [Lachnospiraceae bacterium]
LQALSYEKQLQFKQEKIRNNLVRIGGFEPEMLDSRMEPIVGMEEPFHYRNKAQYPVGTDREGNVITGFYAGRTHSIIANTDCFLGAKDNKEILEIIIAYMSKYKVSAYREETGEGLVRHILIRKGFTSRQIMVCLVINKKTTKLSYNNEFLPHQSELLEKLATVDGMTSVSVSINTEKTNVIMGKEIHTLWGEESISDVIHVRDMKKEGYPFTGHELCFHISPLSFYQVNPVQTEKLYSLALEYAGLTGQETVWDLYCGIGTISLFLADKAKQVYGVEIIPQAIEDARKNAENNQITNAEFYVGKAEEVLPRKYKEQGIYADVIVVDPPRKGCDEACLSTMLQMQPKRIVYVSCDSATLARDLKILCDGGYEIQKIRGVDQFGMTVHCESCVLLRRTNTIME